MEKSQERKIQENMRAAALPPIVIERDFDVPVERLFSALSHPESLGVNGTIEEKTPNEQIIFAVDKSTLSGDWPEDITITLKFSEVDENSSRVHLHQTGIPLEAQSDYVDNWHSRFDELKSSLRGSH